MIFERRSFFTLASCLPVCALLAASPVHAATATPQPTIVGGHPVVVIDQGTNAGTAFLRLRNDTRADMRISMSSGSVVSLTTGKELGAKVTFWGPGDSAGKTEYELAKLGAGALITIKIDLANVWEAGESEAALDNRGVTIGKIKATKYRVPLSVKVDGPGTDKPELSVDREKGGNLLLRNDDPMTYPVTWQLLVSGKPGLLSGKAILPPTSSISVPLATVDGWFPSPVPAIVRDEVLDGVLTVRFTPDATVSDPYAAVKTLAVKVRLKQWSAILQEILGNGLIFAVLALGAVCSLLVSYWFPNRLKRADLIDQLEGLRQRTRSLSSQIPSSLRIQVRVERERLRQLLDSRMAISPDLSAVFVTCEQAMGLLAKQLDVLTQMDRTQRRLALLKSDTSQAPPTLLRDAEKTLEKASDVLSSAAVQDKGLQEAERLIFEAAKILENPNQENKDLAARLAKHAAELAKDFDQTSGRMVKYDKFKTLATKLKDLLDVVGDPVNRDETQIKPERFYLLDITIEKLFVMRHYILRFEDSGPDQRKRILDCEEELLGWMKSKSWDALYKARILLKQIEAGIFEEHVRAELERGADAVEIQCEPLSPRPREAVKLRALFNRRELNRAAARERFECVWRFPGLASERGWEICHYFMPQKQEVRVSFEDADGQPVTANGQDVKIDKPIKLDVPAKRQFFGDRAKVELSQLVIVLVVTMLGLVAGAREQILKLDFAAGLIAVFLIGFGADQIKKLLAQRPQ